MLQILHEPVQSIAPGVLKYDPAQPRDRQGRFAETGSVTLGDRQITVVKPRRAASDTLVSVDVSRFDARFKGDREFYLDVGGGKNAIGNRYERFGKFIAEHDSIEASEVYVGEDGRVGFTNGRHRYAWLRDQGITSIPVAMTSESVRNAKKHGYLSVQKFDPAQARHPAGSSQGGEFALQGRRAEIDQVYKALVATAIKGAPAKFAKQGLVSPAIRAHTKGMINLDLTARLKDHPAFKGMEPHQVAFFVKEKIDLWAETSGDSSIPACRMQYAVKDEFGLPDAEMKHLDAYVMGYEQEDARSRAFVRAEYERTQEWFREQGITHVSVFRGMEGSGSDFEGSGMLPPFGQRETGTMQPASSWTTSVDTAMEFAKQQDGEPLVLTTRIPVSDVLSTCVTGRGSLVEEELILLGKPQQVNVFDLTRHDFEGGAHLPPKDEWTRKKILASFR